MLSRRRFGTAVAGVSAAALLKAEDKKKEITQASVPGDPDAPGPQTGTVAETQPFASPLQFQRRDVRLKAEPFALDAVRLLPSPFADAQEANRAYLHRLAADRLVHNFRLTAGLPSKAEPLGGWEKPDCELRGHFVGHYLSACALEYGSTKDQAVKAKGDEIVAAFADCQKQLQGGYLSAFPTELFDRLQARRKVWAPFYTIHKLMAGLYDMHLYAGNQQALTVLQGMAHWTDTWTAALPETQMQMVLDTEYGGMNDVLYNLAATTGDARCAAIGDRFTKQRFFNPLALRRDQLRGLHTNTHIPQVIGAARRYELSGDQRFFDVADYFWQTVVQSRTYVTGGTSNNEGWLVEPNRLAQELALGHDTNECCCAYNMMKLSRMLYTWTADPRYFDHYERALYNHRLGTIDANGMTQYYLGIVPGSWRTFGTEVGTFWCCNGTGVEEYAKLTDSIYFHSGDQVYVNLFIPSELRWTEHGVTLRQTTKYPQTGSIDIAVVNAKASPFTLNVRIPGWLSGFPVIKINGKTTDVAAGPGSYVALRRAWKTGDRVTLELPMEMRMEAMPDDRSLQAAVVGPQVMAGYVDDRKREGSTVAGKMGSPVKDWTAPDWSAASKDKLLPLRDVPAGRAYSIYWRTKEA